MNENKAFYSIKEFAALLGVHHTTIRRAIINGRLSAFRIGASERSGFRIPASETQRLAIIQINLRLSPKIEDLQIKEGI